MGGNCEYDSSVMGSLAVWVCFKSVVTPKRAAEKPLTEGDIRAAFQVSIDQGTLPENTMPEKVLLVEQIAKTSVGKNNKKQMRQDFSDELM